ncbi:hypothetical protein HELRODRAFT_77434 [Helobdella robusta]|uniref:Guanylate cyclase n=1 Tax=Helobdella robusta TaxID=6412 RepID=T1G2X6_HELRO|nr:hypothetical protein HELRODRAFT_77434 [Helobdella robusta]ESO05549.1 hypothetical protein HELRODRAFT_77434 [Helobdella robusta]
MVALHKGDVVTVNYSSKREVKLTRKDLVELVKMKDLQHDNIIFFLGACIEIDRICYLTQYCARGNLQELLAEVQTPIDWTFTLSFTTDLTKGMNYLHKSFVVQHGKLSSSVCMIDNNWVLKVTGFGLPAFRTKMKEEKHGESFYRDLLWTAPEHLFAQNSNDSSQKGDVFSFAIIVYEMVYKCFPYQSTNLHYKDIIMRVLDCSGDPFRPVLHLLNESDANPAILNLIKQCWAQHPNLRPPFDVIEKMVKAFHTGKTNSIVDSMLKKLEKYASNLEAIVEQRTEELIEEKKKTDVLLNSILPPFIAEELKAGRKVEPKVYQSATVYFSDIVGFTTLSSESTPMQIVDLLNDLYGAFDDTISKHNVYKVETIGDAYMVVSGLPQVTERHVVEICNMALDLLGIVKTFKIRHRPEMTLMLRIGIHSGPCAAGVVGHTMPRYCLFGDTVNTASRMESTGEALKIHLSTPARDQLLQFPGYVIELRGPTELKGKGTMITYWLLRKENISKDEKSELKL